MPRTPRARCTQAPRSIPTSLLALTLLSVLATTSCAPSLRYDVDARAARTGDIAVRLRVRGAPRDSLVLRAYAPTAEMRLSGVTVDAPGSAGFVVDSLDAGNSGVRVPRVVIRGPLPQTVTVSWHVAPGVRQGDAHMGWTGTSIGDVSERSMFTTGRALFLVPSGVAFGHVRVRFDRPAGWSVATPWQRGDDAWAPGVRSGLRRGWAAEDLLTASLGIGAFEIGRVGIGGTEYSLAFDPRVSAGEREQATAAIEHVARTVRSVFGRDLGTRYLVVVMPETVDGDDVAGGGWATGQGGTLVPLTAARLHTFARRLIGAYLTYGPNRTPMGDPKQAWVADAVAEVLAWRAVANAGFADVTQVARDLASEYKTAREAGDLDTSLEALSPGGDGESSARTVLAPLTLLCLGQSLAAGGSTRAPRSAASGGAAADFDAAGIILDGAIHTMFSGVSAPMRALGVAPAAGSFWNAFPPAQRAAARTFRERYVAGRQMLPVESFFDFASAQPDPVPPRGPVTHRLTLAFTGNTHGYLENCGCRAGQAGGLARRATALARLRAKGNPVLAIDAGGTFPETRRVFEADALSRGEQQLYLATMRSLHYDAVVAGETELAQGSARFLDAARASDLPWVLANVRAGEGRIAPPWQVVHAGNVRVAVIGLFGPPRGRNANLAYQRAAATLTIEDPVAVLQRELPKMRAHADLVLAAGRFEPALIRRMIAACPDLDVALSTVDQSVVRREADDETTLEEGDPPGFVGRTLVLYATLDSYGLGSAALGLDAQNRIATAEASATWLGDDVPDDPATRAALTRFYESVGATAVAQASVPPLFARDAGRMSGTYVGVARCSGCHAAETEQWKRTSHSDAFKTLLDIHRNYQPRCVVCHVVGYGTPSGWRIGTTDAKLVNVQCEMCHGPGGEHVLKPVRENIRREVPAEVCLECHTPEHSNEFVYANRLPRVVHGAAGKTPANADSARR